MTGIEITPTRATTVFRLPSEFACAWSPGFDLHVSGTGDTEKQATESLVFNLRKLGLELIHRADEIQEEKT